MIERAPLGPEQHRKDRLDVIAEAEEVVRARPLVVDERTSTPFAERVRLSRP